MRESSLEGELRHQSVAGEHRPRIVEVGIARGQIVQVARAVGAGGERVHIIHTQPLARIASGDELGVIDNVPELRTELELASARQC